MKWNPRFREIRILINHFDTFAHFLELGNVESLRNRFKKRDIPRASKYVPQRLKLSANGEGAQMSGFLRKKQKNGTKWKRLWFVLKDRVLYAYKAPEDSVACDTYPILGFVLETLSEVSMHLTKLKVNAP